ncbi:hypothetical protein B0J11DRAFT_117194 [Dendryphion nanum]|uniref:Uncharacterized protein n=1 Tax=Dendryphion nanum TaxID=256645 RepID=A0A9P9ICT1_9PLEO|nr:hypothetical protein B0J11DRAFT_117194 [Dendryphion nanum]
MAHEDNFHGDVVRLTAFLRIVEDIPPRPTRCRKRTPDDATMQKESPMTPLLQEFNRSASLSEPLPVQALSQNTVHLHNALDAEFPQTSHELISQNNTLEISKSESTRRISPESSGTRRRRLPLDELALVRTSTADSLHFPGDDAADTAMLITTTDPIEDSQAVDNSLEITKKTRSTMINGSQWNALKRTKNRKGYKRQTIPRTVNDGFTASELDIAIKIPRKPPRKTHRNPNRKASLCGVTLKKQLSLASGCLPFDPDPTHSLEVKAQDEFINEHHMDQSTSRAQYTESTNIQTCHTHTYTHIHQRAVPAVEAGSFAYMPDQFENQFAVQFSSITAPEKEDDTDSDEQSDESYGFHYSYANYNDSGVVYVD